MNKIIQQWFENNGDQVIALSDELFHHPETALKEYYACKKTAEFMRKQGFTVEEFNVENTQGMPNCVVATYGSGHPVIGIMGEFDALDGLGQEAVPYHAPIDGPGHGCGHNLLAGGNAGAAAALKAAMEAEKLQGTVKFFGCPAEETVTGKVLMIRNGMFKDVDVCYIWHPNSGYLAINEGIMLASTNMMFSFHGKSSHAAAMPDMGRSALDAAELMNVGVQYLREHVPDSVRIHYTYTAGGEKPNIVPDFAQTNYYIRAATREIDDDIVARVKDIANGAALMTGTTVDWKLNSQVYETFINDTINWYAYEAALKVPPIEWDESDREFAETLFQNVTGKKAKSPLLSCEIDKPTRIHQSAAGSSDVSDVSHNVPTCQLSGPGMVAGLPVHHWSATACTAASLGHKAELYAGKVVAQCGYDVLKNPSIVEEMWKEFRDKRKDMAPYKPIQL